MQPGPTFGSGCGCGDGSGQSVPNSSLKDAYLERPLLGLRALLALQARMPILAVLVRRADEGAVTLFFGVRGNVAEGVFGAAGVGAGAVAGARLDALRSVGLPLAARQRARTGLVAAAQLVDGRRAVVSVLGAADGKGQGGQQAAGCENGSHGGLLLIRLGMPLPGESRRVRQQRPQTGGQRGTAVCPKSSRIVPLRDYRSIRWEA